MHVFFHISSYDIAKPLNIFLETLPSKIVHFDISYCESLFQTFLLCALLYLFFLSNYDLRDWIAYQSQILGFSVFL